MKLLAFCLALCLLCGCARRQYMSYPGAFKRGKCSDYAAACSSDLQSKGVEAYYISYFWDSADKTGWHACVLFKQGAQWFCVDNTNPYPIRVRGSTILGMLRDFDPAVVYTRTVLPDGFPHHNIYEN